ncbi:MAG TPA: serine/threonine-protein kinase, partial [Opitutaceae bacterium]
MNPSGSDELLILRLLGLPEGEREACMQRACIEDPRILDRRQEIQEAVKALEARPSGPSTGSTSSGSDVCALQFALEAKAEEAPGTWIGHYKLLQQIGEGGFGVVWMAEQQAPIRRRVALKIVKHGMDTREVIARFESERQALALMDHPNIATVFDAGATDAGRPFFAMELVRGVPITRYCDENRLPPESRLRLFIAVCQAVQHAHQKGIIHRDLKPSNILVTLHDGQPVPKIIDFGVAKATSAPLTDKTLVTQFHAFIGTPAYTSPEQMEMSGLDVDTRSDIYSLGVLLYELLTGRPPFDPDALARSGLEAMRRTVREVEPPRPSARIETLTDGDRTTVANQRGTDSGSLSLLLKGDLDWIVMRCLEKDRTRRYETANGLAVDVQHHLANEPVSARPPSRAYWVHKFIRRHKLGVAAATAVALSLIAGLIASSVLLVRERAAHERAVLSERAESELRRQADEAREHEAIRASRTARDLAGQLLAQSRTAEGLAWLVHAARKNPRDTTIAPRLASVLASRRFLVPEAAPLELGSRVHTMFFFPDGARIFILCENGTLAVINTATGHVLRDRLPSPPRNRGSTLIHRGLVGVLCQDGIVRVIDRETAQTVREIRLERAGLYARGAEQGDTESFEAVVLRDRRPGPAMRVLLEDRSVAIVDIETGRTSTLPIKAPATPWGGDVTMDGRWFLVTFQPFRELEVWNTATGEKHRTLSFSDLLGSYSICRDGRRMATLSSRTPDSPVLLQLWSFPDLEPLTEPQVVENMTRGGTMRIVFSPDDRWLFVSSPQGKQVYEVSTGRKSGAYVASGLEGGKFSPDGRRFVSGMPGGAQLFDTASGAAVSPLMPHNGRVSGAEFNADGTILLTTCMDGFVRLWDANTGQLLAEPTLQQTRNVDAVVSSDGAHLVLGTTGGTVYRLRLGSGGAAPVSLPRRGGGPMPAPFIDGKPLRVLWLQRDRARVIDVASGREIVGGFEYPEQIEGLDSGQRGIGIRSDLRFMVVRTTSGQWQSWALGPAGITRVVTLEHAPDSLGWIRFSPVGDIVAIIANDNLHQVRFWDLRTGKPFVNPCASETSILTSNWMPGAFSMDGRHFAAGTSNGTVNVWDVATGAVVFALGPMRDARIRMVEYSPDGSRIVAANIWGEAQLWEAATGQATGPVLTHGAGIHTVAFSNDGKLLLTGSSDGTARVWHTGDGSPAGKPIVPEPGA